MKGDALTSTKPTTTIAVECGKCGYQYLATPESIRRGTWRRDCPVCHPVKKESQHE